MTTAEIMKRFAMVILSITMVFMVCSCHQTPKPNDDTEASEQDYMKSVCTKEHVDEFMTVIEAYEADGRLQLGLQGSLDKEQCYNVTPVQVSLETDYKIFKFSDTCASLVMIGNEVFHLCEGLGGYGFVNAIPCDFDGDGNKDLLVASSWGSGLHRSVISAFNTTTKVSTAIYEEPQIDLLVIPVTPSFSSKDPSNPSDWPIYYQVYSAEITVKGDNWADLSCVVTGIVGSVAIEDDEIVFNPVTESDGIIIVS